MNRRQVAKGEEAAQSIRKEWASSEIQLQQLDLAGLASIKFHAWGLPMGRDAKADFSNGTTSETSLGRHDPGYRRTVVTPLAHPI